MISLKSLFFKLFVRMKSKIPPIFCWTKCFIWSKERRITLILRSWKIATALLKKQQKLLEMVKWDIHLFLFIYFIHDLGGHFTRQDMQDASVDSNLHFSLIFFGHHCLNYLRVSWNLIFGKLILLLKSKVISRDFRTPLLAWDIYPKRQWHII